MIVICDISRNTLESIFLKISRSFYHKLIQRFSQAKNVPNDEESMFIYRRIVQGKLKLNKSAID